MRVFISLKFLINFDRHQITLNFLFVLQFSINLRILLDLFTCNNRFCHLISFLCQKNYTKASLSKFFYDLILVKIVIVILIFVDIVNTCFSEICSRFVEHCLRILIAVLASRPIKRSMHHIVFLICWSLSRYRTSFREETSSRIAHLLIA